MLIMSNPLRLIGIEPLARGSLPAISLMAAAMCNGADPVCSAGDDVGAHSFYVQSGMADQAATFAASLT